MYKNTNINSTNFEIIYNGKILTNEKLLMSYDIEENSILYILYIF